MGRRHDGEGGRTGRGRRTGEGKICRNLLYTYHAWLTGELTFVVGETHPNMNGVDVEHHAEDI